MYGTAWKKEDTAFYTNQALEAGIRSIDTAAQMKHYNEKEVLGALYPGYIDAYTLIDHMCRRE